MERPIFIVGANRSGTTLLRLMLNAHPRIGIPDEVSYFQGRSQIDVDDWAAAPHPEWYRIYVEKFVRRTADILDPLDPDRLLKACCDVDASERNWKHPYATALGHWAAAHGKARWGEKTPGNLFFADVLIQMFPDAQFIYLVRDPRAGVHSMLKTSFFRGGTVINALNRRKYMREGYDLLCRAVPASQRMVCRFEDLVHDPEATMQAVCDFLGEAYMPEMLTFHRDAEQYMKPSAASGYNATALRPVSAKKAASWRTHLTPEQIAEVEWICGDEMERFGYAKDGVPLPWSRRWAGWLNTLYFRIQCYRHRDAPQFIQQDRPLTRSRIRLQQLAG